MSEKIKKICIIGAGAAGLAAAWSLGRSSQFNVTLYESSDHLGGVATTIPLPGGANGSWLNNQVQAGSQGYHNTQMFFAYFGFKFNSVNLRIAIGTGDHAWNNKAATPFMKRMQPEIDRFHRLLRTVQRLKLPFLFISIGRLLKMYRFSDDFTRHVAHPLMSFCFASATDSMKVPAIAVAQVAFDEDAKMFDFTGDTLLSKAPVMATFPNLAEVYAKVAAESGADIRLQRRVVSVVRDSKGVKIIDDKSNEAVFDEVIMACPAHVALKILDRPSWLERFVLGRIKSAPADIVIHSDGEYIKRHYSPDASLGAQFYVRRRPDARDEEIEMTYHMNAYQDQLKDLPEIYQTIGPLENINSASVIEKRTVTGNLHTCEHFASIVPLWRFIQGRRRTWYCGGHTMINIHEIAIISGLAVAKKMGSPYPFDYSPKAKKMFDSYFALIQG